MERPAEVHRDPLTAPAPRRINWWIVAPLVWAVPATIATLQQAATYATRGMLGREWLFAVVQFPRYMLWAPLTPIIFAAVRRYAFERPRLGRNLLRHLGIALLCIALVEGISAQLLLFANDAVNQGADAERPPLIVLTLTAILTRLLTGLMTYAAVCAVAHALESQRRLREEAVRTERMQRDLADAQVQAIKMQVQPHFLFNTLHAVNVLIEREPRAASRMVTRLGDLLRHTLDRAAVTEVPLRTELEALSLYLEIERARFHDRLSVVVDAASDTLDALVPDLILQPLAENAIKHGIGSETAAGTITVRTRRHGNMLEIEVTDSGQGPPPAFAERVGLTTVRGRLERLYGSAEGFTLQREGAGGCVARIRLPCRSADG